MSDNGYADRTAFLNCRSRRYRDVTVPGIGKCRIRNMTEAERSAVELENFDEEGKRQRDALKLLRSRLVATCVCDAEGDRLFSDGDAAALVECDSGAINVLVDAIYDHCGIAEDAKELEKN